MIEKGQRFKITSVETLEQSAYIVTEHITITETWRRTFS